MIQFMFLAQPFRACEQITFNAEAAEAAEKKILRDFSACSASSAFKRRIFSQALTGNARHRVCGQLVETIFIDTTFICGRSRRGTNFAVSLPWVTVRPRAIVYGVTSTAASLRRKLPRSSLARQPIALTSSLTTISAVFTGIPGLDGFPGTFCAPAVATRPHTTITDTPATVGIMN